MDPILTIAEASKLIAEKKLSPVELTNDCLARMKSQAETGNCGKRNRAVT